MTPVLRLASHCPPRHHRRNRSHAAIGFRILVVLTVIAGARLAHAGNVTWAYTDFIAGCPAADTVIISSTAQVPPHPSMLRIAVTYNNSGGSPKNGVPPESIWVDITAATGNIKVNDETKNGTAWRIYASDSTRSTGFTRIFVPSCSGCGTVNVTLYVAGVSQGTRTATIRTVDSERMASATTTTSRVLATSIMMGS
ncbi:MAG: hypothetical protein E6K80_09190 [Candidatus Eisenbacteria bacterium]|uniref:Uncharacterized protein n=1 Tax=Eiseniibacteriota bacterium TaxID=2212470 RepID=A0A538U2U5_UNCEI|nr:MAG: hypothetical protein E6K80_09190 [Candidatus Eisenbacteria bacterium]